MSYTQRQLTELFSMSTRGYVGLAFLATVALRAGEASAQLSVVPRPAAATAAPAVPSLKAMRRDGPITLDGKLDEAVWQKAEAARDFTQSWPNPGKPPTEGSEVRVLYDDDAIYVGVRMFDSHPDSVAAQLARRDAGGIYSDWAHVIIDSYHDRRTAFRFTVNPKGVQKDVYTSNDNNEDTNWDAVWDVATRVDSLGWVAEYRIPLSQLRFGDEAKGKERVWGFQFMRDVARKNERTAFSPWVPDGRGFVSRFGDLTGLMDIPQPSRLELLPYVSTKITRAPNLSGANDPFYKKTEAQPNAGADLRYGLPGGLTLTATINPDFGQVEVDPATVNLSAFETFFPEKRPFFLEGSDIFNFGQVRRNNDYGGQTFFYTRRIGRAPSRYPSGPNIAFVDVPDQTRIAGAAKVSGRKGPWTIGILDALTAEAKADVAGLTGVRDSSTAVEPMANYLAARVKRDYRKGATQVGSMLTVLDRQQSPLFLNMMSTSAGFGGVDFEHRWNKGTYVVSGFAMGSRVNGSTTAISNVQRASAHYLQRPDAVRLKYDPSRTSLTGHYEEVALSKNGKWFGSLALKDVSPGFEINDVGFHGRVDYRAVSPFWGYQSNQKDKWSNSKFWGIWSNHVWNTDRAPIFSSIGSSASVTLTNQSGFDVGGGYQMRAFDDRMLRGGPMAFLPHRYSWNLDYYSDTRRKIWFNPYLNGSGFVENAAWTRSGGVYTETRPSSNVRLTFNPNYFKQVSKSQYVKQVGDVNATSTYQKRYVFANLEQQTVSLDTRVEVTLTSKLSVQSYIQPFIAIGKYTAFKEFKKPRGFDFAEYGKDQGTIAANTNASGQITSYSVDPDGAGPSTGFSINNPNFNSHSLRGNAVMRWEYRPGSALYFVWQQQRSGGESAFELDPSRDIGAIFRERPTNIFMIKAAYWLSR